MPTNIKREEIYSRLRAHLDTLLLGAPESDAILEILRIRFSPEEAEAALMLGASPKELSVLAAAANKDVEDFRGLLEQMADKALVFKQTKTAGGAAREFYSLLPTAVGLWETSFATGVHTPKTEQLARHWRAYYEEAWGRYMHSGRVPFTRVVPVETSIAERREIYSYERVSELIRQHDYACVLHCPCRKSAELVGKGCGKPTEVCLHFGYLARFFVERGYAREVSQKQVFEILDLTEKAGLVHVVGNSKEMGVALCSCCTCCCTQLRAISEFRKADAVATSRFRAEVDPGACSGCGACEERCPVQAITFVEETAEADKERCLGCGLCVTACPTGAIMLREREHFAEPVPSGLDLAMALRREKTDASQ